MTARIAQSTSLGLPALLGGEPTLAEPFPPSNTFGADEAEAAAAVIRTGHLSGFSGSAGPEFFGGPAVQKLEAAFARRFDVVRKSAVTWDKDFARTILQRIVALSS